MKQFFNALLIVVYGFFCFLLIEIVAQYIPIDADVAFLRIKQHVVNTPFYLIAFYVHVLASVLVLAAGFTQFSDYLLAKHRLLHKRAGWLYVLVVLVLAAPSGLYIGLFANGGLSSQLAFVMLAILWFLFTLQAVLFAKKGNIQTHRQYMLRSFALTLSAITLRAWKVIIVAIWHLPPMDVYKIVAWLGWVLNLLIVEYIIRFKKNEKVFIS
jgi:uncharacterized membrane protein